MKTLILACYALSSYLYSKPVQVFTQISKPEEIKQSIELPIMIKSKVFSLIHAPFDLIVINKMVKLGDKVKKNQHLITFKNQDVSQYYRPSQLKASVNGVLSQKFVRIGQFVRKGEPMALITDPNNLYGEFELPIKYKEKVFAGQEVEIKLTGSEKQIKAKILGVSNSLYEKLGSLTAEVELNLKESLTDHQLGKVIIPLKKTSAILVPNQALHELDKKQFIFIVKDKIALKKEITTGQKYGDKIQVVSGLDQGEKVIIRQSGFIKDQDEVDVTKELP